MNGVDNTGDLPLGCAICGDVGYTRGERGGRSLVRTSCYPTPHVFHLECITQWFDSEQQKVKRLGERQCVECEQKALPLIRTNVLRLFEDESPYCETEMFNVCRTGNMASLRMYLRQDKTLANRTYHSVTTGHPEHPLAVAIKEGHTDLVQLLISYGADVNAVEHDGESPLYIAARLHRDEEFKMLIGAGANISNALSTSVQKGNAELLEYLIRTKPEPSQPAINNALREAAERGQTQCLILLIKAWATDFKGALSIATERGQTECLKSLIENNGWTAHHSAATEGHAEIVKTLPASHGTQLNEKDVNGLTALHYAASKGHTEIVKALLAADGIKVNEKGSDGLTALHVATLRGHTEIVKALLAADGIKVNEKGNDGGTALHYAASKGYTEIVKALLVSHGIKVNEKGNDGWTSLHHATSRGHTEIVKALLATNGINVNEKENDGWTALHVVAVRGHTEIVKALLAADSIKVNEKGINGWTALHVAASKGHTEIVKALLAADGIWVNEKGNNGWTTLHYAVFKGYTEIVKALLAVDGIRVNEKQNDGKTALDLASKSGCIAELLIEKGACCSSTCLIQ